VSFASFAFFLDETVDRHRRWTTNVDAPFIMLSTRGSMR
jgi:hypothetical protein